MATGREIVTEAFRDGNLIPITASLTDQQLSQGLNKLNGFINNLYGFELGEQLRDWPLPPQNDAATQARFPLEPADERLRPTVYPFPPPNARILMGVRSRENLTMPQSPDDGARMEFVDINSNDPSEIVLDTNGRQFNGQTGTLILTPQELNGQRYLYRAELGNWRLIQTYTADMDVDALPDQFDDLLVLSVLDRIGPSFGRELTPPQNARRRRHLRQLQSQYYQTVRIPVDRYRNFAYPAADYDNRNFFDDNVR